MFKRIASLTIAFVMILSMMTVGVVSVGAKPQIDLDLPEWEWAITEVSTGNLLGLIDESDMYAFDPEMLPGYYVSSTDVPENIGEIKVELYHLPAALPLPQSGSSTSDNTNYGVVLTKTLNLADLEATSPYSGSIASYSYGERDSETKVYTAQKHSLSFDKSSRRFEANVRSEGSPYSVFFVNKKFMDNLYRDQIVEECGEPLSFAEWMDRSSNSRYELSILVSKDGETWYKLYPMTGVKATVVGGGTYQIESRITKYWDYSIPHLGAKYWMLTEGFTQSNGVATPTKPLATGPISWYDYGNDFEGFEGTPTASDFYNAYINAPDEYKTDSLNARTGAIILTVPSNSNESEISQSGNTGSSIVTLDYNTANLRVTVPTVLPVSVDSDNNVTVANNAKIINNSNGQVDVTNAVLSGNNSWKLAEFDTDFKKVPVDTKQYGFKLQGYNVPVSGNAYNNQFGTIAGNASLDLSYDANVAIQSEATKDAEIGNIVFTVAWHK